MRFTLHSPGSRHETFVIGSCCYGHPLQFFDLLKYSSSSVKTEANYPMYSAIAYYSLNRWSHWLDYFSTLGVPHPSPDLRPHVTVPPVYCSFLWLLEWPWGYYLAIALVLEGCVQPCTTVTSWRWTSLESICVHSPPSKVWSWNLWCVPIAIATGFPCPHFSLGGLWGINMLLADTTSEGTIAGSFDCHVLKLCP